MPLTVTIITPERPLFTGECDAVTLPAHDGLMGVRPGHEPFVTNLGIGLVDLTGARPAADSATQATRFAVREGFLQIVDDQVSLLARHADEPADVDAPMAEARLVEIDETLTTATVDEDAFRNLQADRAWQTARLKLQPS